MYKILFVFCNPMKRVRLIKTCLNKTYNKVRVGKYLSDIFPLKNGLKNQMIYGHCFLTLFKNVPLERFKQNRTS